MCQALWLVLGTQRQSPTQESLQNNSTYTLGEGDREIKRDSKACGICTRGRFDKQTRTGMWFPEAVEGQGHGSCAWKWPSGRWWGSGPSRHPGHVHRSKPYGVFGLCWVWVGWESVEAGDPGQVGSIPSILFWGMGNH